MAKKFIDADILFKNITDHHYLMKSSSNSTDYGMFTTGIKQAIDEQPSADVQEVVRCKDCNYYDMQNCYCEMFDFDTPSDDFYCREGERMDGEENEKEKKWI